MSAGHKLYDTAIAGRSASHYAGSRLAMILRTGIRISLGIAAGALLLWTAAAQQQQSKPGDLGFTDTPILPGMKWHVHDPDRPHPPVVTPGATPYAPPSDATVLFDGKDLSKWAQLGKGADAGKLIAPTWPVKDGYFECSGNGDLMTREKFGDIQLHVEWSEPRGRERHQPGARQQRHPDHEPLRDPGAGRVQEPHLRRWTGGRDLRAMAAAGQPGTSSGAVARRTTSCSKRRDSTVKNW